MQWHCLSSFICNHRLIIISFNHLTATLSRMVRCYRTSLQASEFSVLHHIWQTALLPCSHTTDWARQNFCFVDTTLAILVSSLFNLIQVLSFRLQTSGYKSWVLNSVSNPEPLIFCEDIAMNGTRPPVLAMSSCHKGMLRTQLRDASMNCTVWVGPLFFWEVHSLSALIGTIASKLFSSLNGFPRSFKGDGHLVSALEQLFELACKEKILMRVWGSP